MAPSAAFASMAPSIKKTKSGILSAIQDAFNKIFYGW
jgi:hypothetical protein